MYNKSIFEKELNLISNERYRNFISKCLDNVPEYFWRIPASSSGKYHPKADLGKGGLIRHTKACIQVGLDLVRSEIFEKDIDVVRDLVIGSLLLHDCIKSGFEHSGHTEFLHPIYASDFINNIYEKESDAYINEDLLNCMSLTVMCIRSHMGKWCIDDKTGKTLPVPINELNKLVHLADYIASRKYIDMNEIGLFEEE